MLILTIGGWSKLAGMKPLNFVWCLLYLMIAVYIWRWARGAAADRGRARDPAADRRGDRRNRAGRARAGLIATTPATRGPVPVRRLGPRHHVLGFLTVLLIPVEILLIVVRDDRLRAGLERRARGASGRGRAARHHARRTTAPRPPRPSRPPPVRRVGFEPTRPEGQWLLRPSCLPFHHRRAGAKSRRWSRSILCHMEDRSNPAPATAP